MATKEERHVSAFNLAIVLALCLGSLTYGYSFSITSTTIGQPSWYKYFDLSSDPTSDRYAYTNSIIGGINGAFSGGGFFGALVGGWSCDGLGRKRTLMFATPIAILAGGLQAGARNLAMFLVGRVLGGFAAGVLMVLIPMFQSEIAPPASRGFLVSQHGVVLVGGYAIAAWIGYASYFSSNDSFQWRFPLSVQVLWPLIMLCLTPFLPESPRWLLMRGRSDEAWAIVERLHDSKKDTSRISFAREEFYVMKNQVAADLELTNEATWSRMFRSPSGRKRLFCAFMTMFGTESTCILVVYNYSVILYQGLGLSNTVSLLLAAVYVTIATCGNYISSLLMDRVGRVKLIIIGMTGCMVCLILLAALTATYGGTTNKAGLHAGVFFFFFFVAFYGCCLDATTYVYCSEIFPNHLRAKGMAWSLAVLFLSTVAYLIPAATAFATIGWKYYLVFIILTAINIPIIWFTFPETKGLALEEISEKFGDKIALHLTHLTAEQREELDRAIESEKMQGAVHAEQADQTESA
ncbi:hypothetical protein SBRCBS47491_009333 [Sporothrix bragantina]|uniref:Major facilitator superfamily (MFS) profile domain-containing protein n=1 Tax=Sporothrix bragantina TaxID=671064 RepID=A0ABP0CTT5_9PEZI